MRTAPTRADRRLRTRAELAAAADRCFTADGYHATSLDAVADEAGFTSPPAGQPQLVVADRELAAAT